MSNQLSASMTISISYAIAIALHIDEEGDGFSTPEAADLVGG